MSAPEQGRPEPRGASGSRMPRWTTSLTAKYIAVFALLVTVPVVATSAYLLDSSYNDNKNAIIRQQKDEASSLAAAVNLFFNQLTGQLAVTVGGTALTPQQVKTALEPVLAPSTLEAFYIDPHGRKTVVNPGGGVVRLAASYRKRAAFTVARRKGTYFGAVGGLGAPEPTFQGGSYPIVVSVRQQTGGGVVGERLSLGESYGATLAHTSANDTIVGLIKREQLGAPHHRYIYAVDAEGRLAVDPVSAGLSDYKALTAL